jgi:hypothetical protein
MAAKHTRTAEGIFSPPPEVPDAEQAELVADLRAQERGPAPPGTSGLLAPGYVHVDVRDDVLVFLPGELLPQWVAELLEAQHPERDRHGVFHLKGAKQ